ncbi:MAG: Wzz/FepE/Etk N-terminal domain-containing protein [Pseudomonadota bacterium]|nr:Wzz/FepE/Etk N-terminal domain-containing protein [Pseudomonadota bacterium]
MEAPTDNQLDLDELIRIIRRRMKPALIALCVVFALSVAYAIIAEPTYRSESTILIEQQEIPQDLVRSTVTSFADQRIQMIIQRVMTYSKLVVLIKKYDLYAEEREKEPLESVIEEMRDDIHHRMISADVVDPRSGRPIEATIAFNIGYESHSAKTAQLVANELTSLFLSENIKTRQEMADDAEAFLAEEVKRLEQKSRELEAKLAEFKELNLRKLPEMTSLNMSLMDRTEREYFDLSRQIQSLEERRVFLEASLAQQEPNAAVVGAGEQSALTPAARARLLQNQYISYLAMYSENHPDVIRVKRELENLVGDGDFPNESAFIEKQLDLYEAELATARNKYGEEHPDVRRLESVIAAFNAKLKKLPADKGTDLRNADNPSYVQLATSLKTVDVELSHLKSSRAKLREKLDELEVSLLQAPTVEREYRSLSRDYENTTRKYQELKAKQLEAGLAKSLEDESKGERFTLIEPPLMPEKPVRPNRMLIVMAGFILAAASAVGMLFILEKLDRTLRSPNAVSRHLGRAPLAVIPHIITYSEAKAVKRGRLYLAGGLVMAGMMLATAIHLAWMPLDVLWYAALRKLG